MNNFTVELKEIRQLVHQQLQQTKETTTSLSTKDEKIQGQFLLRANKLKVAQKHKKILFYCLYVKV